MTGRDVILYFAFKYEGDWDHIYEAIKDKEPIPSELNMEELYKKVNSNFVTLVDTEYPLFLKRVRRPPFIIFYHGDLSLINDYEKNLAIVGSRESSDYGLRAVDSLVQGLKKNINVISGFARGIDIRAHKAAINNGLKTIAVLPGGINYCYPKNHYETYNFVKDNGLIISEYPDMIQPSGNNFENRNRLIALFSKCTLVIEGNRRSGTSITIRHAIDYNREVLAIPHNISETPSICNDIIRDGAQVIRDSEDINLFYVS